MNYFKPEITKIAEATTAIRLDSSLTKSVDDRTKPATATELSLQVEQNEQKRGKSRKQKSSLSCCW